MRLRPWSECSRSVDSGTSTPVLPPPGVLEPVIDRALDEDLGAGDVTTSGLIPAHLVGEARLVAHERGVLAGLPVAMAVFRRVDPSLRTTEQMSDGDPIEAGETAGTVSGSLASILMAERTALNFLQRMSGIATMTSKFVDAVSGRNPKSWTRARLRRGFALLTSTRCLQAGDEITGGTLGTEC